MKIIVAGLGRCGTSLMMKMLHQAGIAPYCDKECIGNSYENVITNTLPRNTSWWSEVEGKAVKLLDIHRWTPPRPYDGDHYVIIWMNRDRKEQAKSQIKFTHYIVGTPLDWSRKMIRSYLRGMDREYKACHIILKELKPCSILEVSFDELLTKADDTCLSISEFLQSNSLVTDRDAAAKAMRSVIKSRSPECGKELYERNLI